MYARSYCVDKVVYTYIKKKMLIEIKQTLIQTKCQNHNAVSNVQTVETNGNFVTRTSILPRSRQRVVTSNLTNTYSQIKNGTLTYRLKRVNLANLFIYHREHNFQAQNICCYYIDLYHCSDKQIFQVTNLCRVCNYTTSTQMS